MNLVIFLGLLSSATAVLQGPFHRGAVESRLILNPLSILGNPKCEYGAQEGLCYGEVECLALAGTFGNFCPGGFHGLCCIFYRSCGERTSQEKSYFQNPHYPIVSSPQDDCPFRIIKRDSSYCGVRIEPVEEEEATKSRTCGNVFMKVDGVPFKGKLQVCGGKRSLKRYQLDLKHVDEVTLQMNFRKRINSSWRVKVTQIKCDEFHGEELPSEDNEQKPVTSAPQGPTTTQSTTTMNPFLTGRPSTTTTTTTSSSIFQTTTRFPPVTASPPAPPTIVSHNFAECGISGRSSQRTTQSRRRYPQTSKPTKDRLTGPPGIYATRDEPPVYDDTWKTPTKNDSLFDKFAGPELPFSSGIRVTYGTTTGRSEFPWQVAMTVNGRFHCGGSIIGDFFILTAAHCVISYRHRPSAITLTVGDWDLKSTADGPHVNIIPDVIRVHPSYSRTTLRNDIAVIKTKNRIEYTKNIRPVCLPDRDYQLDDKYVTVTGWGRNEHGRLETKLQKLSAAIFPNSLCDSRWNVKGASSGFIWPKMACMSAIDGDSCNGDSGGPAVYRVGSSMVQVGIVSFGSASCSDPNLPGVYTRVSSYRDWILQQMF